jgi:hypothetical protein
VRAQTTGNVLHFSIRESYNKKSVAKGPERRAKSEAPTSLLPAPPLPATHSVSTATLPAN